MNLQQALLAVMAATPCKAPGPTLLAPPVTKQADETNYHPVLPVVQAALAPLSAADRAKVLNFRLDWAGRHRDAARTRLTALGLRADLPETLPEPLAGRPVVRRLGAHVVLHGQLRHALHRLVDQEVDGILADPAGPVAD